MAAANLGDLRYGQGAGPHALTEVGSQPWAYDKNGNLTSKPDFTYAWDFRDRLVAVNGSDGLRQDHAFDYAGDRVAKQVRTAGGVQTVLYPDSAVEVREDQLVKYVFAGDQRVAEVRTPFSRGRLIRGFSGERQTLFGFDANDDGVVSAAEVAGRGGDLAVVEFDEIDDALTLFFDHTEDIRPPLSFATLSAALENHRSHPGASPPTSSEVFYHPDHLGSATVLTDRQGAVSERTAYYPYGSERSRAGDAAVNRRFTGKELDSDTGLYDYGARFYDPVVGRFLSVDPVSLVGGAANNDDFPPSTSFTELQGKGVLSTTLALNSYAYALMNPLKYIDPDGRKVRFAAKSTPEFKEQIRDIISYLNLGKVSGPIAQLERSSTVVRVRQGATNVMKYAYGTKTIVIDPLSGLDVGGGKTQTPALGFLHEAAHALQDITKHSKFRTDRKTAVPQYHTKEERRVIKGIESPAAKKLGEPTRAHHGGTAVQVGCPTCDRP